MQLFIELWTSIDNRLRLNGTRREALIEDHDAPTGAMMAVKGSEGPAKSVVGGGSHRCGDQADVRLVSAKVVIGDDVVGLSLREEA